MRKFVLLLTLVSLTCYGQDVSTEQVSEQQEIPVPEETIPEMESEPSAVVASTRVAKNSGEWRNWVFAASAAVVFTVGVLVVTLNTGATQSGH